MSQFIYLFIYQPLYNILALLCFLFNNSLGWAVLFFAVVLRLLLLPINKKTIVSQKKMAKIQPQIKDIQKKHKDNPLQANKEIRELFKKEQINPFDSIILVFFQLFIFILLFMFFKQAVGADWAEHLHPFLKDGFSPNYSFLGVFDLRLPSLFLAVISAAINALLVLLQPAIGQNRMMMMFLPFIIIFYWKIFPAIIVIYWIGMSLAGFFEIVINKNT